MLRPLTFIRSVNEGAIILIDTYLIKKVTFARSWANAGSGCPLMSLHRLEAHPGARDVPLWMNISEESPTGHPSSRHCYRLPDALIEDELSCDLAATLIDLVQRHDLRAVHDRHIESCLDRVVQEHGIQHMA